MDPRAQVAAVLALVACAPARVELRPAGEAIAERVVLDVRDPAAFAAGHRPGALNLQRSYGQLRARIDAYVPDRTTPLAIRAASRRDAEEAGAVLEALGYSDLALAPAAGETATLPTIGAADLRGELAGPAPPLVVDVREPAEHATGVIPGALLVDPDDAPALVGRLDPGRRVATICELGWRSSQLASLLRREGFHDVVHVIDGMAAWRELEGAPLASPARRGPPD